MPNNPQKTEARIDKIILAWQVLRPDKRFGGMSLAEFTVAVQPSRDARTRIRALLNQLVGEQQNRNEADKAALKAIAKVVNGVKGDPEEGDDGTLYEAIGYVRKSARKSGLIRKGRTPAAPPEEASH